MSLCWRYVDPRSPNRPSQANRFPNSFTARYNIKRLVYFERFGEITSAIAREKQVKRWSRIKKIQLIVASNPDWRDLSEDWGTPTEPFDGKLRAPETFS